MGLILLKYEEIYILLVYVVIYDVEINNILGIFIKIRDFRCFWLYCL